MRELVIGGRYVHYKGNEYTVIALANNSETLEEMVVYRAEYGDKGVWVRPKSWNGLRIKEKIIENYFSTLDK